MAAQSSMPTTTAMPRPSGLPSRTAANATSGAKTDHGERPKKREERGAVWAAGAVITSSLACRAPRANSRFFPAAGFAARGPRPASAGSARLVAPLVVRRVADAFVVAGPAGQEHQPHERRGQHHRDAHAEPGGDVEVDRGRA